MIALASAPAGAALLISENFADGAVGPTPPAANWVGSTGIEASAGPGFATARGVSTTYDNDNNASTPNVNIPGGLEVNASAVSTLTITVTMPATLALASQTQLTFWASVRANNAAGASVSIVDTTDAGDRRLGHDADVRGHQHELAVQLDQLPAIADVRR